VPLEDALVSDPVQAMFCGPIGRMRQARALLAGCAVEERITVLRTEYPHRDLAIVDVLNHGCSKGRALERLARQRGMSRDEVMAIGDNFNDLEMLAFAGLPFIMGNACAELKWRGWPVTLTNDQNGVARAVESVLRSDAF
jgi:hydroxymethylpyrimidine pyrophosphatase-like HAD family hydrolase